MTNQTCISLSSFHFPCQSSASLSAKVAKRVRLSHSHCQDPGGLHLVIQFFLLRISLSPFFQWFLLFLSQIHSISQAPHTLQSLQAHRAQHNPTFERGLLHSGSKGASFGESQHPACLSEEAESESLSIGVIQLVWLLELKFFLPSRWEDKWPAAFPRLSENILNFFQSLKLKSHALYSSVNK